MLYKEVFMRSPLRSLIRFVMALLVLHIALIGVSLAQQSASFSIDRITMAAGGQSINSASFHSTVIAGQVSPSGAASFCNSGYMSSLGFFSILGDTVVPIRLNLAKNEIDPSTVELSWTGNADDFQIYSSSLPQDVLDPLNLDQETFLCDGSDSPGSESLVFYKVIAKATE
jgi:hypothetical protein